MNLPYCPNSGPKDLKTPEYLRKDYKDQACHGPEIERREICKILDDWVDRVEEDCGLKKSNPKCDACHPEFTCLAPYPYKRPFCLIRPKEPLITCIPIFERRFASEKQRVADLDDRVEIKLVEDKVKDIPVWERPRIRSQKLIGGEYKKLTSCFKKNGLNVEDCPRSPSCRLIQSMQEWVEMEKNTRRSRELIECCCCPGMKSNLPKFKCNECQPPGGPAQQYVSRPPPSRHQGGGGMPPNYHKHSNDAHRHHRGGAMNNQGFSNPPMPADRIFPCLKMDNPRSSGEIWSDDPNAFRHMV